MKIFKIQKIIVIFYTFLLMQFSSELLANNEQILLLESEVRYLEQRISTEFLQKQQFLQQYNDLMDASNVNRDLSNQAGISKKQKKKYIKIAKSYASKANKLRKKKKLPTEAILISNEIKTKKALLNEYKYVPLSPVQASRLLQQSTFGPTSEEINQLTGRSAWEWLQQQFEVAPTSHLALLKNKLGYDKPESITRIEA